LIAKTLDVVIEAWLQARLHLGLMMHGNIRKSMV